jgi:hypothetical protein
VIAPDSLGPREEFYQEWCGGGGGGDSSKVCVKDPAALGTYLRESGLLIRRTRKDIGRELPPLSIVRHVVECDHRRIDEAEADVAELARRVLARTGTNLERMQWAGEIDLRMRQATGIGKAPAVADFVRMLVESVETVVLFGWHRSCFARGTRVIMTDGSTKVVEDVSVGDRLLGPDSKTRNVTAVMSGVGDLYRITPNRGQPWICSRGHLLQVWSNKDENIPGRSIPVEHFTEMTPRQRRNFHMRRADLSGDLGQLPMAVHAKRSPQRAGQKNVRHVGFDVERVGAGNYFGFETDGDRLFLLDDFTIVHNCYDIWQSAFERAGIKFAMYTGSESVAAKADGARRFISGEARVLIMSLRSGAGVDGLQHGCCTTVHGELDWSPKVIEQDVGRIFRDGQPKPVAAYILVAESGSDPVIEDVLGLKDAQSSAIMDPDLAGVAQLVGSADDRIRRLAEDILRRRGNQVDIAPRSEVA